MAVAKKQKPRQTTHRRKRHGSHQKRDGHLVKTYWPYIPLLLIVGTGLLLNVFLARPGAVLSYATNVSPAGLLQYTNGERQSKELGSLALNEQLTQAAQAKANDMVGRDYWSHKTPDGQEPWSFINATGYTYLAAGENLAYGFATSEETVRGWMNSQSHRENMLKGDYNQVGFGIANGPAYQNKGNQTIVVALYAQPTTASTETAVAPGDNFNTSGNEGAVKVSRIALVSGSATGWSSAAFIAILLVFAAVFLYRHSKAWHRMIRKGEDFILHHKMLDILLVSGIMMAIILLSAGGYIL